MKEALSIETERMDDLPLLLSHMQYMHLAELLAKHIPTHGHPKRLSVGELSINSPSMKKRLNNCSDSPKEGEIWITPKKWGRGQKEPSKFL